MNIRWCVQCLLTSGFHNSLAYIIQADRMEKLGLKNSCHQCRHNCCLSAYRQEFVGKSWGATHDLSCSWTTCFKGVWYSGQGWWHAYVTHLHSCGGWSASAKHLGHGILKGILTDWLGLCMSSQPCASCTKCNNKGWRASYKCLWIPWAPSRMFSLIMLLRCMPRGSNALPRNEVRFWWAIISWAGLGSSREVQDHYFLPYYQPQFLSVCIPVLPCSWSLPQCWCHQIIVPISTQLAFFVEQSLVVVWRLLEGRTASFAC